MRDLFLRYRDGTPADISDLKIFETVARCGGMKHAAAELNTVQSNVTARIKTLETDIGCALFERHSRGVSLMPASGGVRGSELVQKRPAEQATEILDPEKVAGPARDSNACRRARTRHPGRSYGRGSDG